MTPWIQIGAKGKAIHLTKTGTINFGHVDLEDLIPALSRQCRFNGHCNVFYSVLEHMCLVGALAPVEHKREALLHDLAESVTGDMVTPLKQVGGAGAIMTRIETAVARRFNFRWPTIKEVKDADTQALRIEYRHLLPHTSPWEVLDVEVSTTIPKVMQGFLGRSPEQAQNLFWDMWTAL